MLENRHVAVVGAGIGGIAAGILCARAGARVTLFESAIEPRAVGAGILIQPNGLAVLYGLGLDEPLSRRGARLSNLRIADAHGRTLLDVPVPRFAEGLDHALAIRRSELLAVLVDALFAEPRVTCRFGTEVVDVSADGSITYRARAGTSVVTADIVVGADGVHSHVRKRTGITARAGRTFRYLRGLGPPIATDGVLTEYWTGLGIFGVAPVDHGTYFYASTDAEPLASAIYERDLALLLDAWARALPLAGEVLAGVRRIDDLVVNEVIRIDCEHWSDGRVVLLGDAAHAMAPNLGQGASTALVDAAVLARELAEPGDERAAFRGYERRRRSAVRLLQDTADRIAWLSSLTHRPIRWLRDAATRHLAAYLIGDVTTRFMEQGDPAWLRSWPETRPPVLRDGRVIHVAENGEPI